MPTGEVTWYRFPENVLANPQDAPVLTARVAPVGFSKRGAYEQFDVLDMSGATWRVAVQSSPVEPRDLTHSSKLVWPKFLCAPDVRPTLTTLPAALFVNFKMQATVLVMAQKYFSQAAPGQLVGKHFSKVWRGSLEGNVIVTGGLAQFPELSLTIAPSWLGSASI